MLIHLRNVSSYLEGEISGGKKKLWPSLTSIFVIDLKKELDIPPSYGRFHKFNHTYRSWEDKCSCAFQVLRPFRNRSCVNMLNGKMLHHAG